LTNPLTDGTHGTHGTLFGLGPSCGGYAQPTTTLW